MAIFYSYVKLPEGKSFKYPLLNILKPYFSGWDHDCPYQGEWNYLFNIPNFGNRHHIPWYSHHDPPFNPMIC